MILKVLLLVLAGGLLALSLLTVAKVPVSVNWKLTLVAGEFGYWFAAFTLMVAGVSWLTRGSSLGIALTGIMFCALAIGLFCKPLFDARAIAIRLPEQMAQAFGPAEKDHRVFFWSRLWAANPPVVSVQTHEYSPGLQLDLRLPPASEQPVACVIMIHGGGWDSGDRKELEFFNNWLVQEGYAVASLDYRLAPEHIWPAQRDDVLGAIQWLKDRAWELGIDPTQFVLMGRSAGGQIASATAYTAQDKSIRGVISLYAPHDMPFVWSIARPDDALNSDKLMRQYLGGPPDTPEREARYLAASAHLNIEPARPMPTLLMHGLLDTLVWYRHSERFAASLAEVGHPHVLIELPWAAHAFEYNLSGPAGQLTTYAVRRFLHSVTDDS